MDVGLIARLAPGAARIDHDLVTVEAVVTRRKILPESASGSIFAGIDASFVRRREHRGRDKAEGGQRHFAWGLDDRFRFGSGSGFSRR